MSSIDWKWDSKFKMKNIKNLTLNGTWAPLSYIDCELKPNVVYSYKIISFNKAGSAASNFSLSMVSSQLLPDGFSPIMAIQVNNSLVQLDWSRPAAVNGHLIEYNVYRNFKLIAVLSNVSALFVLNYLDSFEIMPKTLYIYEVYACKEAGCSTDVNFRFELLSSDQAPLRIIPPLLVEVS